MGLAAQNVEMVGLPSGFSLQICGYMYMLALNICLLSKSFVAICYLNNRYNLQADMAFNDVKTNPDIRIICSELQVVAQI